MPSRFYVTTPIYYINDVPHLGSAYTTIAADVLARYHRLRGEQAHFLTGTDEHGLKIQRVAAEQGITPEAFAEKMAAKFRDAWPKLGCEPDDFIRTCEPRHEEQVKELWKTIAAAGDIYLGHYEGLYCVGCEAYYTEKDLDQPGNVCKQHKKPVETMKEESYFFRLRNYAEKLLAFYEANPAFVQPTSRRNEVISFVREGLQDLSVSRTTFNWGIAVPGDPRHVMFVWFDALANYYTAVKSSPETAAFWPANVHLVGKDILRFHAIYWPAFLMSAGLPLPKQVFAHGFLTLNGERMSKSLGNVIDPVTLAAAISPTVGADVVRYTLMRAISFGQDGDFAIKDLLQRYASELGNTLGNLQNRVLPFAKTVTARGEAGPLEQELLRWYEGAEQAVRQAYEESNPTAALNAIWGLLARANEYVDKAAPWTSKKLGDTVRLGTIVATLLEVLEAASVMIAPVMPVVANEMRRQLGVPAIDWAELKASPRALWPDRLPARPSGLPVPGGEPIFPRFEDAHLAALIKQFTPLEAAPAPAAAAPGEAPAAAPIETKPLIAYDDFAKLDLRVGIVVSAEKVKKKDKLLDLRVDVGEAAPRRIIAGIAAAYAPEALVGKRVTVLCNLAPRDFGKGLVSEGMLLAASTEGKLDLVSAPEGQKAGAKVS